MLRPQTVKPGLLGGLPGCRSLSRGRLNVGGALNRKEQIGASNAPGDRTAGAAGNGLDKHAHITLLAPQGLRVIQFRHFRTELGQGFQRPLRVRRRACGPQAQDIPGFVDESSPRDRAVRGPHGAFSHGAIYIEPSGVFESLANLEFHPPDADLGGGQRFLLAAIPDE